MGISKIRNYKPHRGVPISRDLSAYGKQVYLGNGQGCDTFWFGNIEEARKFIDAFYDRIDVHKKGLGLILEELCRRCQNHYSPHSKEYRKYKPFACRKFKEELTTKALKGVLP
ncbi:hypothetical protein [Archaeoglobus neptunius]|uniref:hypothetical protein n=1 Tax=Archaeoglobus neptunius TaxID=2798580 RepID=UPI0019281B33|nr:hypothetical protein [Archaeoglobus neptunius]